MSFELNPQQSHALKMAEKWWKSQTKQIFEISGPAGSGKTSIVYELIKKLGLKHEEVMFMAYVGKAAMALALKGNIAKTIHSTIYNVVRVPKISKDGVAMMENNRPVTMSSFVLKDSLPQGIKLLVIDEGSMPDKKISKDILSFGIPAVVLGDLNQLPPVFGNPFFLQNPDVVLTQIMRQNEDNPIIWLSQQALKGKRLVKGEYGSSRVFYYSELNNDIITKSDIIISGTNEVRENVNQYFRKEIRKARPKVPMVGDKIVCRQNNWKKSIPGGIFLINGLIGYIEAMYLDTFNGKSICIDFRPEFTSEVFERLPIDYNYLFQPVTDKTGNISFYNKFQYAYAITCHLSQGSQYDQVMYYKESNSTSNYQRKLDYTAITRAVNSIDIAIPDPQPTFF